jgi:Flp pilus assembly protein TadG
VRKTPSRVLRAWGSSRWQRGATLVTVAALLVVLVGAVALVTDVGMVMAFRQQLQKATDAAVLAGAQDLPSTTTASATVDEYMARNLSEADAVSEPEITLTFSGYPTNRIKGEATQQVSLWFARVLGKESTTIRAESEAQRMDADIMLVLDRTGSMCDISPGQPCPACPPVCNWEPMTSVKNAAVYFVNQLGRETVMGVVSYNTSPHCDVRLKYLKDEMGQVVAAIQSLQPGRPPNQFTDIGSAIRMGVDSLVVSKRPNPKIMVLITDGMANWLNGVHYADNNPRVNAYTLAQATYAHDKGVVIFVVAFGDKRLNEPLMKQIVSITTGAYFRTPDADGLYPIFHQIAGMSFVHLVPPA